MEVTDTGISLWYLVFLLSVEIQTQQYLNEGNESEVSEIKNTLMWTNVIHRK
jgi:hypothetical protein